LTSRIPWRNDPIVESRNFLTICAAALSVAAFVSSVNAAELVSEPFDYPGSLSAGLSGTSGGTGWSGPWTDIDALPTIASTYSSLDYPTGAFLAETGGRIEVTVAAANNPVTRAFTTPLDLAAGGQTYYSSALFRRSAVTGELSSVLFERASDSIIRWYFGIDLNGFFSVAVNPSEPLQRATSAFTAEADTTYLLVSRMRTNTGAAGADEVFLSIFQEGEAISEPALDTGWDLRASGGSGVMLERLRLAMTNAAGETNEFDEFRVGTTFADVTGVPEPASAAFLAIGAALLARRRRGPSGRKVEDACNAAVTIA
jgi:hypothetical protein